MSAAARVLIVDDDPLQLKLMQAILAGDRYEVRCADGGRAALDALQDVLPDVVLLDIRMPGMDGFQVLQRLKADDWTMDLPVVMVTATDERDYRLQALDLGADDFLTKPVDRAELMGCLRSLLQVKHYRTEVDQAESVMLALAAALEARDPRQRNHCQRLARMVLAVGQDMGLDRKALRTLRLGAYLHDIGKIALSDALLLKTGPWSPAEAAALRTHTVLGEQILRPLRTMDSVRSLVRHHHERLDGSGYPDGLRGDEIPPVVRILSVADAFDAITGDPSRRPVVSPPEAIEVLRREAAQGVWDAVVVDHLAHQVEA